jgi:hypothetical protein
VVETSVVSSAITLKQLAELHSETITCCNCLPQIEQISLCVRYVGVDSDEMCVKESFLGFAEASSTTGEEMATTIMRGTVLQMSSQNLISFSPVVNKSYEIAFLFGVTA